MARLWRRGSEAVGVGGFSRPLSRPARPLAAARCCCFARGLWEVLLLRGQARAPPSSCFDRHRALACSLAHSHRRFPCSARHCGFSRKELKKKKTGPLLRRYNTGAALCSGAASVLSRLASTPKDLFTIILKRDFFLFLKKK